MRPRNPIPSTLRRPVDTVLRILAGGLLITVLVATLSIVSFTRGLQAPRTSIERNVLNYRAAVEANSSELSNHLLLADAYVAAGREDDALATVQRARALSEAAIVDLTEAEVLRRTGKTSQSLPLYDRAVENARLEYEQALADLRGRTVAFEPPNTLLARALQGRAAALIELGEVERSIDDLEGASELLPTDATILATLGDHRMRAKDTSGAAHAYRMALQFVPDYTPALEGLRELEEAAAR